MILAIALAAGVVFATPLPPPAGEAELARAHGEAARAVDLHSDGFAIDGTPEARDALIKDWTLEAEWACAAMNAHPDAPEEAATSMLNSDKFMKLRQLDADTWVVTLGNGAIGSFAILKRAAGQFRPVWYAWRDAAALSPQLQAWKPEAASKDCPESGLEHCGPLSGNPAVLPKDASGNARFYIDADFEQPMGGTVSGQLSVWSWDGIKPSLLYLDEYAFMIDQDVFVRLDGKLLKIREKQDFKTFSACGSCLGRQADHVLSIDANTVRDLGRVSVTPELDTVDAAFDRLHRGLPVEGLASAQAAGVMEAILRNTSEPGENPKNFTLGMLLNSALRPVKTGTELCFSADATGSFIFTLTRRAGRSYIAHARPDSGGEHCKGFPK